MFSIKNWLAGSYFTARASDLTLVSVDRSMKCLPFHSLFLNTVLSTKPSG